MTTDVISLAGDRSALGSLAAREGRRIVTHPVNLVMLVYFVVLGGFQAASDGRWTAASVHQLLLFVGVLWFGPATFFAANLVASSARRANAETQLEATPTGPSARTLATCLGVLAPTAVATGFAAVLWLFERSASLHYVHSPAELAAIPLCALGGGLLGVAVARWLPWRGMPLVVMFALIAWVVAVMGRDGLWWTAPWTMSPAYFGQGAPGAGSHAWHAVYLLGLGVLAAIGALLRHRAHRLTLLALAVAVSIGTLAAAWAQLP